MKLLQTLWEKIINYVKVLWRKDASAKQVEPEDKANPLIVIPIPKGRTYWAMGLITCALLVVLVRVFWLQVINTDFLQRQGEYRYARTIPIAAERGHIYDRHGVAMAVSQPTRNIWVDPLFLKKASSQQFNELAKALSMTPWQIRQKIRSTRSKRYVVIKKSTSLACSERVKALDVPGVGISPEVIREYPIGEISAHVIGFTNFEERGQEGVELAKNTFLTGKDGVRHVIRDRLGRIVEDVWTKAAKPGHNIYLSIDSRIQYAAYTALSKALEKHEALAGAVVVADTQTAEILAMVNLPSYNPNKRARLEFSKIRNRALTDQFEPGSTMKPFPIAKALDSGIVKPLTTLDTAPGKLTIGDRTIGDTHDYGLLTVAEVVAKSSNIGTSKIALELTPKEMWETYSQLGFGRMPKVDLPGATPGLMRPYQRWRPIEQATMSYGHGITVSLYQLVQAYTALARKGDVVNLTLYKRPESEVVKGRTVFKESTVKQIRSMMMQTVQQGGTASIVKVPGYTVAGKTGTANKVKDGRYSRTDIVASFVGIVPAKKPRLIIAVMVDEPKKGSRYGGTVAGPVFNDIANMAMRTLMVTPDNLQDRQVVMANAYQSVN